eukprot:GHUV01033222.1.p1 GENE.GHUV01033222.1~~GHUV01033222.1.p1  ORF type:complete len:128 (+),score=33.50 GHUV01033222.1:672-1055(+)
MSYPSAAAVSTHATVATGLCILAPPYVLTRLPASAAQVYTYEGLCEQFVYQKPLSPLAVDSSMQSKLPRQVPWLKPNPMSMATPQERFTQQFFLSSRTGERRLEVCASWLPVSLQVSQAPRLQAQMF